MYYKKVDGEVLLTNAGHFVLSFFGLTVDDLRVMSREQLKAHVNKFSDVLNDGKNYKTGGEINNIGLGFGNSHIYSMGKPILRKSDKPAGDEGSYSRYFSLDQWAAKTFPFLVVAKASKSEKNKGCEDLPLVDTGHMASNTGGGGGWKSDSDKNPNLPRQNHHPTVKPIKLMSYLITMGSREGDLVLDPFCGSGTTLLAAHQLHRKYLGIELNPEYITLAKERLAPMQSQLKMELWASEYVG